MRRLEDLNIKLKFLLIQREIILCKKTQNYLSLKIQEEYNLSQKAILEMIFKGIEIESFTQLHSEDLNIKLKFLLIPQVTTIEQELHIHWRFLKLLEH